MKKLAFSTISLILSFVLLVLSIIAFVMQNSSMAWFKNQKNAKITSYEMQINTDVTGTLHSYPVTDITGNLYTYTTVEETAVLPEYDVAEISSSIYKRALVIVLNFGEINQTKTVSFTAHRYQTSVYTEDETNFFSNVIKITPAELSSSGVVNKNGTPVTLTNVNTKTAIYSVSINTFEVTSNSSAYFVIEYNSEFLSSLTAKFLGEDASVSRIEYFNDLYFTLD